LKNALDYIRIEHQYHLRESKENEIKIKVNIAEMQDKN
jgi:hypothetical protein